MKKIIAASIAFFTLLSSFPARAADTSGILSIVVDTKLVTYTDAYPFIEDGYKMYLRDWKSSTVDHYASKYNLLTLESFLGEMGERIWTMMDDYYMHTGPFDRGEVCIGTDYLAASRMFREVEIDASYCAQYGFEFVSSVWPYGDMLTDDESFRVLTAKYNGIEFSVEYRRNSLMYPQMGYTVTVDRLPN